MKVLNIGSMNLDLVYSVDHIVQPGETEASFALDTFLGGKGLNQSIALARAGAKVGHAGCIGEGGESLKALEALVEQAGGTICGRMAILAEGEAQKRRDLIYLEKLPLFNPDGSVMR